MTPSHAFPGPRRLSEAEAARLAGELLELARARFRQSPRPDRVRRVRAALRRQSQRARRLLRRADRWLGLPGAQLAIVGTCIVLCLGGETLHAAF
jgi:hypothetical protein